MSQISKNCLWVEKYRPNEISELILDESVRGLITKFVSEGSIPHLLLSGNVGCGKTTISKILLAKLDCDSIVLNASDERGIEVIRDKVKRFAMCSTVKTLKIVFLDEADALTPDAMYSMRNLMETYSDRTRFILTCNYINKIIEPIRSRCQLLEFRSLNRKQILRFLARVLSEENVAYSDDDLFLLIDQFYPDIRSMVNNLQLFTNAGKWVFPHSDGFRNFDKLLSFIKSKDLKSIRELDLDYTECYRLLFDKVEELAANWEQKVLMSLDVSEYMWRESFVPDKSINFAACCLKLMSYGTV